MTDQPAQLHDLLLLYDDDPQSLASLLRSCQSFANADAWKLPQTIGALQAELQSLEVAGKARQEKGYWVGIVQKEVKPQKELFS